MALAFFLTFTTYGTRLHGSEKGSVDEVHNIYGSELIEANADREQYAKDAMKQPPYVMNAAEREIVCKAIVDLSKERGWHLLAAHVRTNHVHVVISAERDPGRIMSDLKSRASRDLAIAGFGDNTRRRWTRHGSTRHLFRDEEVDGATSYTLDEQGERMAFYEEPRTK